MPLEHIKKRFPNVYNECRVLCDLIKELQPETKKAYLDGKDMPAPFEFFRTQHLEPTIRNMIFKTHSEVSKLEQEIAKSEESIDDDSFNGSSIDYFNELSKKCYNRFVELATSDGKIFNMYLVDNHKKREEAILLASVSLAYSMKVIDIAKSEGIHKNLVKNHFRNAQCYEFLDDDARAIEEFHRVIEEGSGLVNRYNEAKSTKNEEILPTDKLIESLELMEVAYTKTGNDKYRDIIKSTISSMKAKQEDFFN